jgi:hypothetical protein
MVRALAQGCTTTAATTTSPGCLRVRACARRTNATRRDFSPAAKFKGFANVKRRDESALMYAVWRHGPVAISIDASLPSFRFYDSGVYRDSACKTGRKHMDHAVLLVGYGTDEVSGEDYWLVKK